MSNCKDLVVIGGAFGGGGGGGGGSSRTPVTAADSLRSVAIVDFVDAISEGEIEGFATVDPLESVYLNDTPIRTGGTDNFKGVTFDYRLGTQNQAYIPGEELTTDENASAAIEHLVSSVIAFSTPVVRTINSPLANAIRITVQTSAMWKRNAKTGDVKAAAVKLLVEVKPNGGVYNVVDLNGRDTIAGKSSSAYERSYHIELAQFGSAPYDIRVSRESNEINDGTVSDTITWKSYTELMYAKLRYPNTALCRLTFDARHFQQVPKRGYLVKGMKVRVPGPAFYDPVSRSYTGLDWDGTFVTAWTRCPAWIYYDIITDPRYGLGKEVPEQYLDKWNLFTIAKRCDGIIADGFGGFEPRYSLDLYLQQDNGAKKVIQDIASNFDAMAFWHGGGIFTAQDAPKTVSALYTPANVIAGRFNYAGSGRQVRYTVAFVQWNDPDDFYKVATEYVEDTDGIARYGYREKPVVAVGCTSRGQAHRAGKRILLTSRLETDTIAFSVGLSGLVNKPGDIIRVSDPLKHNSLRLGGRVSKNSTTTTIPLDSSVELLAGHSYTLCLVMPDGAVITAPVTNSAGTTQTLTTFPPLAVPPDHEAVWSLYSGSIPSKEYRVLWVTENSTDEEGGFYEISAVRYAPEKYALSEDGLQLEPIYKKPFSNTNKVIPPTGVATTDGVYLGAVEIDRYLDVSWSLSTDPLLAHHIVKWSLDKGEETEVTVTGSSYRIDSAKEGDYSIEVFAVNLGGLTSSSVTVNHTLAQVYQINAVSITNLAIKGTGNTFEGRNAEFDWDTDADAVLALSNSFGTGVGGQTPWFRDFKVDVYEGANLLRTDYVTESAYVYSFEKNVEDGGPFRAISIDVSARDFYGNLSNNSVLAVSNPAPTTFANIALASGSGQVFVEYFPPADPDYRYTHVYASQTPGFVPDPTAGIGNLVASGTGSPMSFDAAVGAWYLRLQGIDEFGISGAVYSSQLSINVVSANVETEVDLILADPGRNGDVVVEADRFIIVQPSTYATPTAVFAVGLVGGVSKVGIRGDLVVDGSIIGDSISGNTITANKMNVSQLSAVAIDAGVLTAGTWKTSPVTAGWRVEVSDLGVFPLWFGTGVKNSTNAKFYVDNIGNAYFAGQLSAATGTFSGSLDAADGTFVGDMTAGTISINSGQFHVDAAGNATMESVVIEDGSGNIILSSGTGVEWQYVTGPNAPEDNATDGASLDTVYNAVEQTDVITFSSDLKVYSSSPASITKTSGGASWNAAAYSVESYTGHCILKTEPQAADDTAILGLDQSPVDDFGRSIDYALYFQPNGVVKIYENEVSKNSVAYLPGDKFEIEYDGTDVIYRKNSVVFGTTLAVGSGLTFFVDSCINAVGDSLTDIEFSPIVLGIEQPQNLNLTIGANVTVVNGTLPINTVLSTTANSVAKTAGQSAFDASAYSSENYTSSVLRFNSTDNTKAAIIGLTSAASGYNTAIQFGIYCKDDGTAVVIESGVEGTSLGAYTIATDFEISVNNDGVVSYVKDAIEQATSAVSLGTLLFLDTELFDVASGFNAIEFNEIIYSVITPPTVTGKMTANTISTFIANLAVNNAQIGLLAVKEANIEDLNVSTLKIQGNAVTVPVFSETSSIKTYTTSYTDFASIFIEVTGTAPVRILTLANVNSLLIDTSSIIMTWNGAYTVRLVRNDGVSDTVVYSGITSNNNISTTVQATFIDNPPAGSFTYKAQIKNTTGGSNQIWNRSIYVEETKR